MPREKTHPNEKTKFKKPGASVTDYSNYRRARGLDGSRRAIQNRIELGYILEIEGFPGRIDIAQANYAWDFYTEGVRANRRLEPPAHENWKEPPSIYGKKTQPEVELSARERKELAEAKMKEWNLRQQERTIIRTELVIRFMNILLSGYRDQLVVIPKRISDKLASETDPNKIRIVLEKAINEALSNFHPIEEKLLEFINKEFGDDYEPPEVQHVQRTLSGASRE